MKLSDDEFGQTLLSFVFKLTMRLSIYIQIFIVFESEDKRLFETIFLCTIRVVFKYFESDLVRQIVYVPENCVISRLLDYLHEFIKQSLK